MKAFFLVIFISLCLAGSALAGSYVDMYPKYPESRFWGPIEVITCVDGNTVTTDCGTTYSMSGSIIEIASGTVILPPVEIGQWTCVKATTAAVIYIDPDDADRWVLDGVALADGYKIKSPDLIDDTICFYGDSAAGWKSVHNPDSFVTNGS